jgi:calmodulin
MKDTELEDELIETFKVLDRDGNGMLSSDELKSVMAILGKRCYRIRKLKI